MYRKIETKIGKLNVVLKFFKDRSGKIVCVKSDKTERRATIYTSIINPKYYGLLIEDYLSYYEGGSINNERWRGGYFLGNCYSYKKAREIALNFVGKNKLPPEYKFVLNLKNHY